jgi:hypothetical protein
VYEGTTTYDYYQWLKLFKKLLPERKPLKARPRNLVQKRTLAHSHFSSSVSLHLQCDTSLPTTLYRVCSGPIQIAIIHIDVQSIVTFLRDCLHNSRHSNPSTRNVLILFGTFGVMLLRTPGSSILRLAYGALNLISTTSLQTGDLTSWISDK